MRIVSLFPAFLLVSIAAAQRPEETHEASVYDAYQNFRGSSDSFVFEMKGTESIGQGSQAVHSILYWQTSTDPRTNLKSRAQVELDIYQPTATGEALTMRLVGDGMYLRRYDIARGDVSTTLYGFYGNRAPANYAGSDAPKLLAQLRAATPGLASYLVRLLAEMNPAGIEYAPRFTGWSPGSNPQSFDEVPLGVRQLNGTPMADDTVTDPITGRTFVRGTDEFVFYGMNQSAPNRTVAFRIYDASSDPGNTPPLWEVQKLSLALRSPGRLVDLTITPNSGTAPTWAFTPYSGTQGAAFRPMAPAN